MKLPVNPPLRTRLMALAIAAVLLLADQLSKYAILAMHGTAPGWIAASLPFFNWVLVWNRGVSFGLFSAHPEWMPWILLSLTTAMTLAMTVWLFLTPRILTVYGLACVIGGAVGNILDRLQHGAVVDFLDFHLGGYHWPAFNLADSFIFIGIVFFLWDGVREAKENKA